MIAMTFYSTLVRHLCLCLHLYISFSQFIHEEALAYELAAYFYLELGEREQSIEHFMLAHEKYLEWVS